VIVIDRREASNEDENNFERKHNPMMSQIIPIEKWYHQQKGKPSPIGDVGRPPNGGQDVLINNGGSGPFGGGNDGPPRGGGSGLLGSGGSGPLGGGSNGPLGDQNPKP
jgi:hypothetical protein